MTTTLQAIKPAKVGSISEGTLNSADLVGALKYELRWNVDANKGALTAEDKAKLEALIASADALFQGEEGEESWLDNLPEEREEEAQEIIASLTEELQRFAPPYCVFWAHPWDGADFGFWPCVESIEELPTVEDSDGAKELGEDCKSVNDHGNVTVYGGDGSILLELV